MAVTLYRIVRQVQLGQTCERGHGLVSHRSDEIAIKVYDGGFRETSEYRRRRYVLQAIAIQRQRYQIGVVHQHVIWEISQVVVVQSQGPQTRQTAQALLVDRVDEVAAQIQSDELHAVGKRVSGYFGESIVVQEKVFGPGRVDVRTDETDAIVRQADGVQKRVVSEDHRRYFGYVVILEMEIAKTGQVRKGRWVQERNGILIDVQRSQTLQGAKDLRP